MRLERIARVPQRPAAWTIAGTAAHAGIEAWENSGRELTMPELEDIVVISYREQANMLLEGWGLEYWITGGKKKAEDDLSDREDKAVLQVNDYCAWAISQDHLWKVKESELEFNIMFGDVPVKGYIDQVIEWVDGRLTPRDIKSGTKKPASPIQLSVYGHAIEEIYDVEVEEADFIMLMNPSGRVARSQTVEVVTYDLTQEPSYHRPFLDQMFRDADRGIEAGIFIPNPSDSCERICSVSQFCRAKGIRSSAEQNMGGLLPLTIK